MGDALAATARLPRRTTRSAGAERGGRQPFLDASAVGRRHPTRDEAMAIIRLWHQLDVFGRSDPVPDEATTVHDWLVGSFDPAVSSRALARILDAEFALGLDRRGRRELVAQGRRRTVGDVADEVARRGWIPEVRPLRLLGGACIAGGWFLLMCDGHRRSAGERAVSLAPSTPLVEALNQPGVLASVVRSASPRLRVVLDDVAAISAREFIGCLASAAMRLLTPASTIVLVVMALFERRDRHVAIDPRERFVLDGIPLTRFDTLGALARQLAADP